jgi:hypothetical protein
VPPDNRDFQRPKTNPFGAVPVEVQQEATGVIEGPELDAVRERRPTPVRFKHIEKRVDDHDLKLDQHGQQLGHVVGRVDSIFTMTAAAQDAREAREKKEAEASARRWKLVVPIITALGIAIAAIVAAVH